VAGPPEEIERMRLIASIVAILSLAGAANAQPAPPAAPPAAPAPALTPEQAHGHELFAASCAYCHGARGFATALLEKHLGAGKGLLEARTDLTATYVHHVVRHGTGSMPWYRRAELSDADLGAVAAYLTRKH
jgi:mono/diheme cytochrome c family protein